MPFQAVSTERLYQQVARQIAGLIARGEFRPGDRLPPERDLSVSLGVSRPTVREAMIALEIAGLVEVRVGAGTTVTARPGADSFAATLGDIGAGPIELVQARRLIEGEIAAEATRKLSPATRAPIAEALEMMCVSRDTAAHRAADGLFHRRIAEGTGNEALVAVIDGLWRETFSPIFERMGYLTGLIPHMHDTTMREHAAILEAIDSGDPALARAAMVAHLAAVERVLSGHDGRGMADAPEGDAPDTREKTRS